jgi:hypothetical protein
MILEFFAYFGNVVLAVNVILYFMRFQDNSSVYKIFTIYLLVAFSLQIVAIVLYNLNISSVFFSHFTFVLQFLFLSYFYYNLFEKQIQKSIVLVLTPSVISTLIFTYLSENFVFSDFNSFEVFITYFPIIIYSVLHFYNMLDSKSRFYVVNSGILIYLLGTLVIYLAGNIIVKILTDNSILLFIINMSTFIIFQLLILLEWRKNFYKNIRL